MKLKVKKDKSFLEQLGVKYFQKLYSSSSAKEQITLSNIPSDKILEAISNVIVRNSTIIAFLVGALVTVPLVFFELFYYEKLPFFEYWWEYGILSLVSLIIELLILYLLTLHSIYALLHLIGEYPKKDNSIPEVYLIDRVLIRAALELEEPILEFMGIDPQKKLSKSELLLAGFLYKAKVVLTSFVAKKILKVILPRLGARGVVIPFVPVFVVAFWDAYVLNRSIKDAKLRLFGYYFSQYLVDEILTKKILAKNPKLDIEGVIRAIASIVVLSKSNHPNNLILLVRLDKYLDKEIEDPDSLEKYTQYLNNLSPKEKHYLRVLSTITAVLDKKITKEEKEGLSQIYQEKRNYYLDLLKKMKSLLSLGHIHELARLVQKEFEKDLF
jgi:succinate dehydrogenase hydrophobic anchor subunit